MQFVDNLRAKPIVQKIEKFFPAIAFLGGFSWDSITLGQSIDGLDLLFLAAYYTGALILIILLSAHHTTIDQNIVNDSEVEASAPKVKFQFLDREWSETWKQRFSWAIQFCFGSMFSALVVCYFKSSGSFTTFILVVLLAVLLVCNEFLQKRYESFAISLAQFCLLGTMFLNFAIPHLVNRIGFVWFFISTLLSFGVCTLVWKISRYRFSVLIAPGVICLLLIISYMANLVPPVPLVMKEQTACINFDSKTYTCQLDAPSFWQKIGFVAPSVHKGNADKVYFVSSVYAPTDLKAEIEYRWYYADPRSGKFKLVDKITSERTVVQGGRQEGYRSYSRKKNAPPGKYRVETAYRNGAVIGSMTFDIFAGDSETGIVQDTIQ